MVHDSNHKGVVMRAFGLAGALLLAGCVATGPAPVSERTPPPKPGAKPVPAPDVVTAPKPDAGVVAKPLAPVGPTYTVRQGDTLFSIAKANNIDARELAAWNNADPAGLKVGQVLRLTPPDGVAAAPMKPVPGAVETRPLDGPASADPNLRTGPLAQRVPYSDEAYARMAKVQPKPEPKFEIIKPEVKPDAKPETAVRGDGEIDWTWPAQGKVVGNFNGGSNKGVAIAGKLGQPVHASAPGRVIFSGVGVRGMGNMIVIRHNANYLTVYAHNSKLLVKEGQTVGKGQRIAEMGNSDADQVKLHFEIRRQGKPVDPATLLPQL
jgi:lipoprotein NlpD